MASILYLIRHLSIDDDLDASEMVQPKITKEIKTTAEKATDRSDAKLREEAQKMGRLGIILGARENAALYLAGTIVLLVVLFLGVGMFVDEDLRPHLAKNMTEIGLIALGFLGGLLAKN